MDEYISRAGIIAEYDRQHQGPPGGARKIMETFPAADVRPVVMCRDCKNRFNIDVCKFRGDDWFCGYGERKREER